MLLHQQELEGVPSLEYEYTPLLENVPQLVLRVVSARKMIKEPDTISQHVVYRGRPRNVRERPGHAKLVYHIALSLAEPCGCHSKANTNHSRIPPIFLLVAPSLSPLSHGA